MFKQVNAAHEAIVGNATARRPQSAPRSPPRPPTARKPPTGGSWTRPQRVEELAIWVGIYTGLAAVVAAQIAGGLAETTGFAEELAVLVERIGDTPTSATDTWVATTLATGLTLIATAALRDKAWRKSEPTPWRPMLEALEALAYTAAVATAEATALTLLIRHVAQ